MNINLAECDKSMESEAIGDINIVAEMDGKRIAYGLQMYCTYQGYNLTCCPAQSGYCWSQQETE